MVGTQFTRRQFLGQAALAGGGTLLLAACTHNGSSGAQPSGDVKLPPIQGATLVSDPSALPKKLAESPDFAKLVSAGKLPPVSERIGQDPLVLKPVGEPGKYGGELRTGIVGLDDNYGKLLLGCDQLLFWDNDLKNMLPNIARAYDLSKDGKVLTMHLRRGMKWSDGHPFTADDIIFWRQDIDLDSNIKPASVALTTSAGPIDIRKLDDYTVEYVAPIADYVLPMLFAAAFDLQGLSIAGKSGSGGFAPKHYVSQFLPKYTSESEASSRAKKAGFDSWPLYILHVMDYAQNPDLPTLTPWITTRPMTNAPWTLEANPYSVWVDTAGNQLPYIPQVTLHEVQNTQTLNLQVVAGQLDFQCRGLQVPSIPVLLKNQQRSNYTLHKCPSNQMDARLRINTSYVKDMTIGNLLRELDFRRALSLGINRDQINQISFLGSSHPSADMVADSSPYFPGPEWRTKWATHDVAQANKLLDGLGLTKKDGSGNRLRPDGKGRIELAIAAVASYTDFPGIAQLVAKQWKDIGIFATVQTIDPTLILQKIDANEIMFNLNGFMSDDVFLNPQDVLPTQPFDITVLYANWLASGGKKGTRPPASLKFEEGWQMYQEGLKSPEAKRVQLGKEIYKLHADLVWGIGIAGQGLTLNGMYTASNRLGNVPQRIVADTLIDTPLNAHAQTFYFKS